ncbi:hypothetical protein AZE42_07259, partial [Rhizopogon vesiculosus]
MLSHGNITHALLALTIYGMELGKVQAPSVRKTPEGTLVHQMVHHPRFKTVDLTSVKSISCSAVHLALQLAQQLRTRFPDVGKVDGGFGLSEVASDLAFHSFLRSDIITRGRQQQNKPGSVGIIFLGVKVRIVRPNGSLAGPNEVGELSVRGAGLALGYKGNDKATRETFVDGWVRTGDHMRIDEDGVLFFEDRAKDTLKVSVTGHTQSLRDADRAKDTLKVSGTQVSPLEIQTTLLAHPDNLILDATVAGVTGGRTADERIPRAWVVFSPAGAALGGKEVVARLEAWVQERL